MDNFNLTGGADLGHFEFVFIYYLPKCQNNPFASTLEFRDGTLSVTNVEEDDRVLRPDQVHNLRLLQIAVEIKNQVRLPY